MDRRVRAFPGRRVPRQRRGSQPHVIYLAIGFPPAAKSCAYRMRETANQFCALGWDVTVVTICQEAWEREFGLDHSLSDDVDPRVKIVELPLVREDLETNIRAFSEARSLRPHQWIKEQREREQKIFPEPVFGGWRMELEKALLHVHRAEPADLLVTTCVPYVNLAATWRLWQECGVPYVVDFRDGWSVDVIGGGEAFARDSVAGSWEEKVLAQALAIWCVNDPIAEFYRERYPALASRVRTVRNGYDRDSIPARLHPADPAAGLTFGYLGVLTLPLPVLDATLTAWRLARQADPVLARSRFEVRGQVGAAWAREDNALMELLMAAARDDVVFGGPVPKAEVASVYGRWDVIVFMLTGGRYMTSGKVYEFMATGLPIVSAHESVHGASAVLSSYPLWTGAVGLDPERLAGALCRAAELAIHATDTDRAQARQGAQQFARDLQVAPAVRQVADLVRRRDEQPVQQRSVVTAGEVPQ